MNEGHDDNLQRDLAELTQWEGEAPDLWKQALQESQAHPPARRSVIARIGQWPARTALVASLFVVVIAAIVLAVLDSQDRMPADAVQRSAFSRAPASPSDDRPRRTAGGSGIGGAGGSGMQWRDDSAIVVSDNELPLATDWRDAQNSTQYVDDDRLNRAVIRKATIELTSKDVRATFHRASMLINEARDEYIADSSLTGSGKEAQANITLRVAADRLSEVMNGIRELGDVTTEQVHGDDVTAQMVDLDARLRNEQRVEAELLELMDARTNDELRDLLNLREQLNRVRESIERLQAQQHHLNRLVELATILLIIRPEAEEVVEPEPEPEASLGAYFGESVGDAWSDGLRYFVTTVARTLEVIVGGLMWWALIIALFMLIHQRMRRKSTAEAAAIVA